MGQAGTRLKPTVLHCPACGTQHVDTGKWAKFNHKRHLCFACGAFFDVQEANVGVREAGRA